MADHEYVIETDYGYGDGWEATTAESTREAALAQVQVYRREQPEYRHRMMRRKIKK